MYTSHNFTFWRIRRNETNKTPVIFIALFYFLFIMLSLFLSLFTSIICYILCLFLQPNRIIVIIMKKHQLNSFSGTFSFSFFHIFSYSVPSEYFYIFITKEPKIWNPNPPKDRQNKKKKNYRKLTHLPRCRLSMDFSYKHFIISCFILFFFFMVFFSCVCIWFVFNVNDIDIKWKWIKTNSKQMTLKLLCTRQTSWHKTNSVYVCLRMRTIVDDYFNAHSKWNMRNDRIQEIYNKRNDEANVMENFNLM